MKKLGDIEKNDATITNNMKYHAVIDTNVLVSFLLTKNPESSVVKVMELIKEGTIVPLLHHEITKEYNEVLRRCNFGFNETTITDLISILINTGISCDRQETIESFPDPDDIVFYEVSLSVDDAYLVTGNLKHFPKNGRVVTPAEMLQIIHFAENSGGSVCEPDIVFLSDQKRTAIEKGWQVAEKIRQQAAGNGTCNITIDEINRIIREYRQELKKIS